ncbi:uncharacterized protein LOC129756461 [Uranotaenia lowii]|uniref:uncharacterized protein LOC129756461 n=1 Tax=Uranotaenia lowii TaxID=190385 RepID=UPI00247A5013|nr:uncharacterized protein LOC129756461 [Uranotaenia lowii]
MRNSRMSSLFTRNMEVPYARKYLKRVPIPNNSGQPDQTLESFPANQHRRISTDTSMVIGDKTEKKGENPIRPEMHTMCFSDTDSEEDEAISRLHDFEMDEELLGGYFFPQIDSDISFNADNNGSPILEDNKFEAMMMVLHIFLRHNLSIVALEDILRMVNLILKAKCVPECGRTFLNFFNNPSYVRHHICSKCGIYLGKCFW